MDPELASTPPKRLILVGMMGSGKTTVGHLLAAQTGWPYADNDALLHDATGRTAIELADAGEHELRSAETAALTAGLAMPEPCIVGVAAGAILDPANRRAMRAAGLVLWLRARPETLARRASGSSHRPWLKGDVHVWMRRETRSREKLYFGLADIVVQVDDINAQKTVARILAHPSVKSLVNRSAVGA